MTQSCSACDEQKDSSNCSENKAISAVAPASGAQDSASALFASSPGLQAINLLLRILFSKDACASMKLPAQGAILIFCSRIFSQIHCEFQRELKNHDDVSELDSFQSLRICTLFAILTTANSPLMCSIIIAGCSCPVDSKSYSFTVS